jgi:E3 ubiquitin-protein ligase SHPRH
MGQLRTDIGRKGLVEKDILVRMPYCPRGGILSAYLVRESQGIIGLLTAKTYAKLEEADQLIDQVLNAQSRLLWQWRTCIYNLLTQSLTASNDQGDADGQEYSRTLDTQAEAEIYLRAYAMLLADRREVLSAERTALAVHDAKEHKHRKTAAAAKATALKPDKLDLEWEAEDIEPQPEHDVLKKELMDARKALLIDLGGRAVKSIVVDLTAVAAKIAKEDDPEKILAREGMSSLRRLMSTQGSYPKCMTRRSHTSDFAATINDQIEGDLALFRKAFNERIL